MRKKATTLNELQYNGFFLFWFDGHVLYDEKSPKESSHVPETKTEKNLVLHFF